MKLNFLRFLAVGVIGAVLSVSMFAQGNRQASPTSSLYVISAKAGAVNYLSGDVSIQPKGAKKVFLHKGDEVQVGDKVSTGGDGRAEILLNPGSYIRLAENSEFEFVTTSLEDDLQLKLNRGNAIFEVIADKEFKIAINTPNSRFYLISSGIYRIDALENGAGKISVWKGKAQLGDAKATTVKGGKTATFDNMQVAIAKFDRDNKGEFDLWSKTRAEQIAKINERLVQRQMRQSLMSSFNNTWDASNGYGLWVRDPFSQSFCFLPFGYGSRSPYGFGYSQSIWNYNPPPQVTNTIYQNPSNPQPPTYSPPTYNPSIGGGNNGGGNNGGGVFQPSIPPASREREQGERPTRQDRPDIKRPIDN